MQDQIPSTDLDTEHHTQEDVVSLLLSSDTYKTISEKTGWSISRIYHVARKFNVRKTERRISERAAERRKRQHDIFADLIGQTTTADVIDYLSDIPDDSAALIITSPPYNIGKSYGNSPSSDSMRHLFYIGWLYQIISECSRILKPGGTLILQVGATRDETQTLIPIDSLLIDPAKKAGLGFISRIAWVIPHGLTPKRRLAERYETAMVFSKGEQTTFNPSAARIPQKQPGKRAFKGPNKGKLSGHPLGAHPTNVWNIPAIGHNNPEQTDHPAQFPLELAKRAIMLYSMPGDIVIDPFSGSGTTHAACIQTGRTFSGADLYYEDTRSARLREIFPDLYSSLSGVTDESLAVWQAEARPVTIQAAKPTTQTSDKTTQTHLPF